METRILKSFRSKLALAMLTSVLIAAVALGQEQKRLTPAEIEALPFTEAGAGTSGVRGIQTRVLKGDPTRPGLYTIQLRVPANTTIQAHDHPDDRIATVISGTWYIGFGSQFDEKKLKALNAGSFYEEPPVMHFARTGNAPVVLQITGYGMAVAVAVNQGHLVKVALENDLVAYLITSIIGWA